MRAILLVCLFALAGCAEGPAPVADEATVEPGQIRGVVVDETIVPVEGVAVAIASLGRNATTDAQGMFTFEDVAGGTYFLQLDKVGHVAIQATVTVHEGKAAELLTVQLPRIPGIDPRHQTVQFDGYYECAFALFFITDSCDFVVRTVHDETGVGPRTIQNNVNTEFYALEPDVETVILEGFFDNTEVAQMWFMIADTPIDNACDCSDDFAEVTTDTGYGLARADQGGSFPSYERDFAARGFLPFTAATEASYALGFGFQILTSKFHNYQPSEGWNFVEQDSFPDP